MRIWSAAIFFFLFEASGFSVVPGLHGSSIRTVMRCPLFVPANAENLLLLNRYSFQGQRLIADVRMDFGIGADVMINYGS